MNTKEKNEAILLAGYTIGQPTGVLYHGFTPAPEVKPLGISSSQTEVIKWCYSHLKSNKK
jgi:hypothetical protein